MVGGARCRAVACAAVPLAFVRVAAELARGLHALWRWAVLRVVAACPLQVGPVLGALRRFGRLHFGRNRQQPFFGGC